MERVGREAGDYFASVAEHWDELRAGFFTEEMRDDAIGRVPLASNAVVADIGTGTGFVAMGLAPHVGRVICCDASTEMLAVARANLSSYPNVELLEAPGDHVPLPGGTLDAVFANMYLHHAPDPPAAIVEMARLLKPGGFVVLTDADEHDQTWMREAMADRWLGFRRGDIRAWMEAAGLTGVSVDCAKGRCRPRTADGRRLSLGIFVAVGSKPRQSP